MSNIIIKIVQTSQCEFSKGGFMIDIPKSEKVFDDLSEVFPVVYTALDYGVFQTRGFFENEEQEEYKQINKSLAPNLVRYHAIKVLKGAGQEVIEDDDLFQINQVPNNGLCIVQDKYVIRILKSAKGELPTPGQSESRQRFYEQYSFSFPSEERNNEKLNLLLLWEIDLNYNLTNLSLACPKSGKTTIASVVAHWHRKIPDSFLHKITTPNTMSEGFKEEDLPITEKQLIIQKKVND